MDDQKWAGRVGLKICRFDGLSSIWKIQKLVYMTPLVFAKMWQVHGCRPGWRCAAPSCTLLQHLTQTPTRDERGILFHCFGGINRSSAALCAWLIFRHGLTTQEAVRSLLTARPTLCPWTHQPHVLWALHTWEKNQDQVIRPRILAEVQQMSVSTPGPA